VAALGSSRTFWMVAGASAAISLAVVKAASLGDEYNRQQVSETLNWVYSEQPTSYAWRLLLPSCSSCRWRSGSVSLVMTSSLPVNALAQAVLLRCVGWLRSLRFAAKRAVSVRERFFCSSCSEKKSKVPQDSEERPFRPSSEVLAMPDANSPRVPVNSHAITTAPVLDQFACWLTRPASVEALTSEYLNNSAQHRVCGKCRSRAACLTSKTRSWSKHSRLYTSSERRTWPG